MGDDVVIEIGGDSGGAVSATTEAAAGLTSLQAAMTGTAAVATDATAALSSLGAAMTSTTGATQGAATSQQSATDALNQLTNAMNLQHDTNVTLQSAVDTLGASYGEQAAAFLSAAGSADDYSARLNFLQAQIQLATDAQEQQNAAMGEGQGAAGMLGDAFDGLSGMVTGAIATFGGMAILQVVTGWLQDATNAAQDFADQMFQLNNTVEKEQTSWGYIEGGGTQGPQLAQQLMNWTKTASYGMPYTRQDLLSAITNLMTMPGGMTNAQIEQYMPILADIGATRSPNLTLSQIAQAIMGAEMGYSRMLRYDLHIDPTQLEKYGLKIKAGTEKIENPEQLLPALAAWVQANGYGGASQAISTDTWWGEWSSFIDRIQNFELSAGSSLFKDLKGDLDAISAFWDAHQNDMNALADALARLFGTSVTDAGQFLLSLFQGMGAVGTNTAFMDFINAMEKWLSDPNLQAYFDTLGQGLGAIIGFATNGALGGLKDFFTLMSTWTKDLKDNLPALQGPLSTVRDDFKQLGDTLAQTFTPDQIKSFQELGGVFLELEARGAINLIILLLEQLAVDLEIVAWLVQISQPELRLWGDAAEATANFLNTLNQQMEHLGQVWNQFTQPLSQATAETSQFAALIVTLPNDLGAFQQGLSNVFTGLAREALTWGKDLADSFAKGILAGLQDIAHAASSAAAAARGPLHFSHPDEGPLMDFESWPVDLMRQYAAGMDANLSVVARASRDAAQAVAGPFLGAGGGAFAAGASYVSHSSASTSHTYDDHGSIAFHLHPMNDAEVEQLVHHVIEQRGGGAKRKLLAPGGYRRFGDIGFSGGRY